MAIEKKPAVSAANEPVFAKESLLKSKRFKDERDIISALLVDGEEYTIKEVDDMIEKYMKGMVK